MRPLTFTEGVAAHALASYLATLRENEAVRLCGPGSTNVTVVNTARHVAASGRSIAEAQANLDEAYATYDRYREETA